MSYRPKYYRIQELVNPKLLTEFGEEKCWEMLDADLLFMADAIRDKYGVITVNDLYPDGLVDCGLRDWRNPTTGSSTSAHCHGNALDLHIMEIENRIPLVRSIECAAEAYRQRGLEYNKVRAELMAEAKFDRLCFERNSERYPNGIPWLHIDIQNRRYREFDA
jgi:hypothetical protein